MAIAAVPRYLGNDFRSASPGMRFSAYLPIWRDGFAAQRDTIKEANSAEALKQAGSLNANDKNIMVALFERQQRAFAGSPFSRNGLMLDAMAVAPFTTGLGNEHPLENGFAFLNPYGLPYLPGSGVKGVLRQAARELASGEWGETYGWTEKASYPLKNNDKPLLDNSGKPILINMLDALFGRETADGDSLHLRGALTFWDVIPQIKGEQLTVEIMTPHQKHYYQEGQSPHDSGQPIPISFLTVPPGSGFTFNVLCNQSHLQRIAPELAVDNRWKILLEKAFEHAFNWLGFGAKTSVGYGAMAEDQQKKVQREQQEFEKREQERRASMSPENLEFEENQAVIDKFRHAFDQASKGKYVPGQEFDSKRNEFIKTATEWQEPRSRAEAANLLADTVKWGVSKKGKDRLKAAVEQLRNSKG